MSVLVFKLPTEGYVFDFIYEVYGEKDSWKLLFPLAFLISCHLLIQMRVYIRKITSPIEIIHIISKIESQNDDKRL